MIRIQHILLATSLISPLVAHSQEPKDSLDAYTLDEVVVQTRGTRMLKAVPTNSQLITAKELCRAACCNLGESFSTNPSVDVSYSDAATGSRQIKLLGLSGSYVQMLVENTPAFRGASAPYGLGYIAGPWMQSIQVSKGASSVKNGYESVTGQINIELRKPQLDQSFLANAYVNHQGKAELNALGNVHLNSKWSTGLLAHVENSFMDHDNNNDGFVDMPRVKQGTIMNRWAMLGSNYVFQAAVKGLLENRRSGQIGSHGSMSSSSDPYIINIDTRRVEGYTKNAFIFDRDNDGNIALILSGNHHSMNSDYGLRRYNIDQTELYASLMFERKWNGIHALSTGLSFNHDNYRRGLRLAPDANLPLSHSNQRETVGGIYSQYTLTLGEHFTAMGGIRYDYNSLYGSLVTPRIHARYTPITGLSLHASAGIGRRSPYPMEEYNYLLASSRTINISPELKMERAANYGIGAGYEWELFGREVSVQAEYYYTDFSSQLVADIDRDPHAVYIFSSSRPSLSHAMQIETTVDIIDDMSITAAYRYTDVQVDYGRGLQRKPLTSPSKGLITWQYQPMMGLWQFDVTGSFIGGGNMPTPYSTSDGQLSWNPTYKGYFTLNAQVTRNFRSWSIYLGGENLTGYRQPAPIIDAAHPWSRDFDATMVYGPLEGAMIYAGFRYNFTKY